VSKKEIRRAARDAFPKAKNARTRQGSSSRVKRTSASSSGSPAARNVPKPPSLVRSLIFGFIAAVFYFVLIQWIFRLNNTGVLANLLIAALGLLLFAGVNYLSEGFRYRRYLKKKSGSGK
jgi:hypothetical protein